MGWTYDRLVFVQELMMRSPDKWSDEFARLEVIEEYLLRRFLRESD